MSVFILNFMLTSMILFSMKGFIVPKVRYKPSPQNDKTLVEI